MSFRRFVALSALFAAPAGARETIGAFATWASFCDEPRQCYAISMPVERRGAPYLTVTPVGPSLIVRVYLGFPIRAAAMKLGDIRFVLTAMGSDATADIITSRHIVQAMRQGQTLTVIATSTGGGRIRHHYGLAGAPSAIDAAALADGQ